jgi:hypothetical protein
VVTCQLLPVQAVPSWSPFLTQLRRRASLEPTLVGFGATLRNTGSCARGGQPGRRQRFVDCFACQWCSAVCCLTSGEPHLTSRPTGPPSLVIDPFVGPQRYSTSVTVLYEVLEILVLG